MKIRNGFVSNSSSSSFLIGMSSKPKSAIELAHLMFGNQSWPFKDTCQKCLPHLLWGARYASYREEELSYWDDLRENTSGWISDREDGASAEVKDFIKKHKHIAEVRVPYGHHLHAQMGEVSTLLPNVIGLDC